MTETEFKTRVLLLGATIREGISFGEPYDYVDYEGRVAAILTYPATMGQPVEPFDILYKHIVEHIRTHTKEVT